MPQQILDRFAGPRVWLLLMKLQSLCRCQTLRTRLGVMAVHLAQHLQHVAALAREVRCHLYELSTTMSKQLASRISTPPGNFGTLRDSASHI